MKGVDLHWIRRCHDKVTVVYEILLVASAVFNEPPMISATSNQIKNTTAIQSKIEATLIL